MGIDRTLQIAYNERAEGFGTGVFCYRQKSSCQADARRIPQQDSTVTGLDNCFFRFTNRIVQQPVTTAGVDDPVTSADTELFNTSDPHNGARECGALPRAGQRWPEARRLAVSGG